MGKLLDGNTSQSVHLQEPLATLACCLDTKTSQLPYVFEGLKNGLQGHVTSRFRGQGSVSPASPSRPDTEDKAHIESRPQRQKGQGKNSSRFQGDGPEEDYVQRNEKVEQGGWSVCSKTPFSLTSILVTC